MKELPWGCFGLTALWHSFLLAAISWSVVQLNVVNAAGHIPLRKLWSQTRSQRHDSPDQLQSGPCYLYKGRKICADASIQTCNWKWQRWGEFPAPLSHQRSAIITPDGESLFLGSCGFNFGLCPAQAAQTLKKWIFYTIGLGCTEAWGGGGTPGVYEWANEEPEMPLYPSPAPLFCSWTVTRSSTMNQY